MRWSTVFFLPVSIYKMLFVSLNESNIQQQQTPHLSSQFTCSSLTVSVSCWLMFISNRDIS